MKTLFQSLCLLVALASLGVSFVCLVNPHRYYLYLLDIFSLPLLAAIVGLVLALAVLRQRNAGLIALVAAGVMVLAVWPQAFAPQPPADMHTPPVRLMFANIYINNKTPEKILPWIKAEKPDIIAIVEQSPQTHAVIAKALVTSHPYQYAWKPWAQNAVYSRYPIVQVINFNDPGNRLAVKISTPNGPLTVAVTHLGHPGHGANWIQRFQLSLLNDLLASPERRTTVLVGDFNTTVSGYLLPEFARAHGLNPLAAPVGTWPSALPGALRIGIDNAFAGLGLSLSHRKVGPDTGSDHRPIVFDIRPSKAN